MTSWLCVQQYFSVFILPIYFFANLFNESVARFSRIFGKKRRTRFQIGNRILNADCNAHIHDTCQKCTFLCVKLADLKPLEYAHDAEDLYKIRNFILIYDYDKCHIFSQFMPFVCVCAVFFRFTIFKLIILMYIKSLYSSYGNVHQKIG